MSPRTGQPRSSDPFGRIACTTPSGAPVDTVSVVQYYAASGTDAQETAYLWADQPAAASYRPAAPWSQYSTPIGGYYQCGSSTHPGGGVMGAGGRNAALKILGELR